MARSIDQLDNTQPIDATNPYGAVRDETSPGSNDGTPSNEALHGDVTVFFQRLMAMSGVTPNGLPDNTTNGFQFFESLLKYIELTSVLKGGNTSTFTKIKTKVIEIGDWNMDSTQLIIIPLSGIALFANIRKVDVIVRDDDDERRYSFLDRISSEVGYFESEGSLGLIDISGEQLYLRRTDSADGGVVYDTANFSQINYNRGWVTITYEE